MYQPTIAASTATIVPASSALTMNGNVNSSRSVGDEVERQRAGST